MAHEISFNEKTGKHQIAFVGEKPWHGLGQELTPGQGINVWAKEAGLDYEVLRAPVIYKAHDDNFAEANDYRLLAGQKYFKGRDVLYRSDTGSELSIVSSGYQIVQPSQVLDFFGELAEIGGFELETAGALSGGKRVWGLAKINDGAPVIGHDVVRPYVLFATSYDGTLATTAKLTAVRVICNNTITAALGRGAYGEGKTESDTQGRAVSTLVRIPHSAKVDVSAIRKELGIFSDSYEKFLIETRLLAEKQLDDFQAAKVVKQLVGESRGKAESPVEDSRAYKRIIELFNGEAIGSDLSGGRNAWQLLNACTQLIDHERGNNQDTRLASAWFGAGDHFKTRAFELLQDA